MPEPGRICPLIPRLHAGALADFYARAADYVLLETGTTPDAGTVEEFFADAPPGSDPASSLKLGLYLRHGQGEVLAGIVDLGFGYPEPEDAYLGLMLLAPEARGQGWGRRFLSHVIQASRGRGARRLVLAVLEENPRGRAFWESEGFRVVLTPPPMKLGRRLHLRHRMARDL
jgi:GNAT superfamily N-acetyltransferase